MRNKAITGAIISDLCHQFISKDYFMSSNNVREYIQTRYPTVYSSNREQFSCENMQARCPKVNAKLCEYFLFVFLYENKNKISIT